MSIIVENIELLIEETDVNAEIDALDIGIDSEDLFILEGEFETEIDPEFVEYVNEQSALAALTPAARAAGEYVKQNAPGVATAVGSAKMAVASAATSVTGNAGIGASIANAPAAIVFGVPIAAIAAAGLGAYAVYKYLNSIWRLKKVVDYYSKKASAATGPDKAKWQAKVDKYTKRLQTSQAAARTKKATFIEATKAMQAKYNSIKTSNPTEAAKLAKKLAVRNKLMAKIGAL